MLHALVSSDIKRDCKFAAVIPVGPGTHQWSMALRTAESLIRHEPWVRVIVFVDDNPTPRRAELPSFPGEIIVLRHSRVDSTHDSLGNLCVCMLSALACVFTQHRDVDFIIKLDTDAFVIGEFSAQIKGAFQGLPGCGILGTLGDTCDRQTQSFRGDQRALDKLQRALVLAVALDMHIPIPDAVLTNWRLTDSNRIESFQQVCSELRRLGDSSYTGSHCQGGAYAISGKLLTLLGNNGVFHNESRWMALPLGEDRMLGYYCALAGMTCHDLSDTGEVFGVSATALPFPPPDLLARDYKIIHSIRNNRLWTVPRIYEFFDSH